jgi:hypothetical protein
MRQFSTNMNFDCFFGIYAARARLERFARSTTVKITANGIINGSRNGSATASRIKPVINNAQITARNAPASANIVTTIANITATAATIRPNAAPAPCETPPICTP